MLVTLQNHGNLFERSITCTLTDTIDGNLNLACTIQNTLQGIGSSHTEVVMAVGRKACLVNAINMLHEILDFVTIFIRQTITCSIRNVHYSSTRLDNSLNDTSQILIIGTACILSIELYVLNILFSILDSSYSTFDDFLAGRIELILDMTVAGTDTGMDSLMLGILQSLSSTINIFFYGTGKCTNSRPGYSLRDFYH